MSHLRRRRVAKAAAFYPALDAPFRVTSSAGVKCLALALIKDSLHQWHKSQDPGAKSFLEGDMDPWLECAGLEPDSLELRTMLRKHGLIPKEISNDL